MDFSALEQELLDRLTAELLDRFVQPLRILLVDEYQDTNLLQEQIYFALTRSILLRSGSITVVGDDDQALYRFRGATVELFAQFPRRIQTDCNVTARTIYLDNNYRSTANIVRWCSDFVNLDAAYGPVRVQNKPLLTVARLGEYTDYPILGMFRNDVQSLALDLAQFISQIFTGNGQVINYKGQQIQLIRELQNGSIGDCALLCSSPREYATSGKPRLPLYLRQNLNALGIAVFNPRGREFSEIESVQQLCGLMLECIDPNATVQNSILNLPSGVPPIFDRWRVAARAFYSQNPPPPQSVTRPTTTLGRFVQAWATQTPQGGGSWPNEFPLMQLLYELITWMPIFQEDREGLVYLEVITRAISQSAPFTNNAMVANNPLYRSKVTQDILWNIFVPLALGKIEIDEDLIGALPTDRFNILSIHQSKGLEFPLVIVDVCSDFSMKHWRQAFKRFPSQGTRAHLLEDELRPFSSLGAPNRPAIDRAFDDLIRQYFVAFSRPQDALLLVGLGDQVDGPNSRIPNLAVGWTRNQQWPWQGLANIVKI